MKLLVIGTSHVGALRAGWDLLPTEIQETFDATFVGFPAPVLAKQVHQGWPEVSGAFKPTVPRFMSALRQCCGDELWEFRPSRFDIIVLVDWFFCYDFAILYGSIKNGSLILDKVPVSWSLFERALESIIGSAEYRDHPLIGSVPRTSMMEILTRIRALNTSARMYLCPRPMMPTQRVRARFGTSHDLPAVMALGHSFDRVCKRVLGSLNIDYIDRPTESICPESGASRDDLSVGWIEPARKLLDEHLTGKYGEMVWKKIPMLADPVGEPKRLR